MDESLVQAVGEPFFKTVSRTRLGDGKVSCAFPYIVATLVLILAMVISLGMGPIAMSPGEVIKTLLHQTADNRFEAVIWQLRLPRTLMAVVVGAGLAVAGSIMQGLFRNPMADPGLTGVAPGAAVATAAAIVFGSHIFPGVEILYFLPIFAFAGGMVITFIVYRSSIHQGRTSVIMLLLVGIAMTAICGAGTGFLVHLSNERQIRDITFWTMGSLGGARWQTLMIMAPFVLLPLMATPWLARALDALNLGEREAGYLGYPVERIKRVVCLLTAVMVGGCVAVSGVIGFVGLLVPHLIRLAVGPAYQRLIPLTALGGAALLVFADLIARLVVAPAELPVGIVTSFIGGPFFLGMLLRMRRSLAV